jgi:hypothetical protein
VWEKIVDWLDLHSHAEGEGFLHFLHFRKLLTSAKGTIWMAVVWCLWNLRNKIIFQGEIKNFEKVLWSIKLTSWAWISSYFPKS